MQQKVYGFLDNLTWIGNGKFSLLLREYSQLAVNVLRMYKNSVKESRRLHISVIGLSGPCIVGGVKIFLNF